MVWELCWSGQGAGVTWKHLTPDAVVKNLSARKPWREQPGNSVYGGTLPRTVLGISRRRLDAQTESVRFGWLPYL